MNAEKYDFDLFVIGGGSGGVRAARIASQLGAKVAITEEFQYGGTCVVRGCVPKKLMVYASQFSESFEDAKGYGWDVGESSFSWKSLIHAKNQEIARLTAIYEDNLLSAKVNVLTGHASFIDQHTVQIEGHSPQRVTSKYILIATGGQPVLPKMAGIEFAISSNDVFYLKEKPKNILIIGAGYIALEFACIFHGLGTKVTIAHRGTEILSAIFDEGLRAHIKEELINKGIKFEFSCELDRIEKNSNGTLSTFFKDGKNASRDFDQVMFATGRSPNTKNMNLEQVGVHLTKKGAIDIDPYGKSSIDNIYAVGDVSSRISLTPVAIRQGNAVAQTLFGKEPIKVDLSQVPSAVFTQPPIGTVGLTEEEALEKFKIIDIFEANFKALKHALSGRNEKVFMKLIVDVNSQRVVGVHMIGDEAPEIIQIIAIALKMGVTKDDFDSTIALHPTVAEELVTMKKSVRKTLQ